MSRALRQRWLALRYFWLRRRYGRLALERISGVPLLVLPDVLNPVVAMSGAFLARAVERRALPEASGVEPSVLDLGTGSGVAAVFAARKGARVVATDLSPEAARCARINALLNRLEDRIEVLEGDLFEPLAGRRFDLVLFNPPFYRGVPTTPLDAAWRGSDVLERFADGLAAHTGERGEAWVVLSTLGSGSELLERLAAAGFVCEAIAGEALPQERLTLYRVRRRA